MTNIIGKAAKRLDDLRRAGIEVPASAVSWTRTTAPEATAVIGDATVAPTASLRSVRNVGLATRQFDQVAHDDFGTSSRVVDLNFEALAGEGFLVPGQTNRPLADDFRIIKMRLLKTVAQVAEEGTPRSNVILVTSALPGEGKTYFSINLALSIAMTVDNSVLLVDADVLRPSVLARLGLDDCPGLTDLMVNPKLSLPDVVLATNVPKLSLLPPGSMSEKASELIASSAMEDLLTQLSARYPDRIIVVDGPPLLVTTVARALAPKVGQVVMVVESARTTSTAVAESFAALEACPHVSAVLNKYVSRSRGPGYGYGYYG